MSSDLTGALTAQDPSAFVSVRVHATTACLAALEYEEAVRRIAKGLEQAPWGALSCEHVQICPQHPMWLHEDLLDAMAQLLPDTQLRLHATVPVMREHFIGERAWWGAHSEAYWRRVAALSRHIKATAYTFHAGTREGHTFEQCLDEARRFEDLFGCRVGIEGLYPDVFGKRSHLVENWDEYRALMDSGVSYAIDLSHLQILATVSRRIELDLTKDLLLHPNCMEIHVSDNDGVSDRHQQMRPDAQEIWWMPLLAQAARDNPDAAIFSESSRPWGDALTRIRTSD